MNIIHMIYNMYLYIFDNQKFFWKDELDNKRQKNEAC